MPNLCPQLSDKEKMKQRIIGFDLARAYAIFGMFIVNFNVVFGAYHDTSIIGRTLALFSGNSSTVFVMLSGMGLSLLTRRGIHTSEERARLVKVVQRRSTFLTVFGLLLNVFWPADILHFYGCYMYLVSFVLFVDKKYYLVLAAAAVAVFHVLVLITPYETGWNLDTLQYLDFYTPLGFIRNTIYNGWNSVFPWIGFFFVGMYLGRLNWTEPRTQRNLFVVGLGVYSFVSLIQYAVAGVALSEDVRLFFSADYLPPFLPFILSTIGFGLMLLAGFMYLGTRSGEYAIAKNLAATGQMTLTHYVSHVTVGMMVFAGLTHTDLLGELTHRKPVAPGYILLFSLAYFAISYGISVAWARYFKNGPLETLMRKISG